MPPDQASPARSRDGMAAPRPGRRGPAGCAAAQGSLLWPVGAIRLGSRPRQSEKSRCLSSRPSITRSGVSLIIGKKPIQSLDAACPGTLAFGLNGPTRQLRKAISPPIHLGTCVNTRLAAVHASKAMPSTVRRYASLMRIPGSNASAAGSTGTAAHAHGEPPAFPSQRSQIYHRRWWS